MWAPAHAQRRVGGTEVAEGSGLGVSGKPRRGGPSELARSGRELL